jgi:hypothetical protein
MPILTQQKKYFSQIKIQYWSSTMEVLKVTRKNKQTDRMMYNNMNFETPYSFIEQF